MNGFVQENDFYAGDAAWLEWFEVCSVAGCTEPASAALRREVSSAMCTQLARYGLNAEALAGDDPVAFFDAYFKLKGSKSAKKPLKAYFEYRIRVEKLKLSDFVCGTLFGARSGRIRDIVLEWISVMKGWRAHSRRNPDGTRRLEWERAADVREDGFVTLQSPKPVEQIDRPVIEHDVDSLLARISESVPLPQERVALILYVMAMDVPLRERMVLRELGVGKSKAYQLRDLVIATFRGLIDRFETATDAAFGEVLLERCSALLPAGFIDKLGGRS